MIPYFKIEVQGRGRPKVPLESASDKTKSRMVQQIKENYIPEIIFKASEKILKDDGNKSGAKIVATIKRERSSDHLLKKMKMTEPSKLSPEDTAAMIINNNMTVEAYKEVRKNAKK